MEHKNKSFGRIKRHQSDKVLRYSIRKYSFGAASVAVAALMFLGTHAVSADVVDAKNQPTIGAPNPNEEKSPLIEPTPTAKNEEIKETEKVEVAKETEEREKPSENKETVEANSLNNGTSTSAIIATKDASADKVTEKQRLDKSQLQASITKVQELLAKVNKEKAPASTLAAIQADLERANSVLNNDSLELTQAEVDEAAKKLNEKVFVLSSMPKVVAPKTGSHETLETPKTVTEIKHSLETVKEDLQKYVKKSEITTDKPNVTAAEEILENISKQLENTTLTSKELTALLEQAKTVRNTLVNEELRGNSGARDSRNGQSMGEGVNFRTNGVPVEGALYDVKEYISEPAGGGSTVEGNRPRTIEKVFMKAKYSTEGNQKFITYDVYFHNDGNALGGNFVGDAFWFYPPRDLLYNVGGNYPVGVVSDAYYERYEKKAGRTGTLSHNPDNFTQVGERYTVPLRAGQNQDYGSQRLWPGAGGIFEFGGGPTRPDQRQQMLKKLENNPDLNRIIRLNNDPNGPYPRGSYSHLLTISKQQNFAYKYHVKMRLKDDVTAEQAKKAGAMAVSAKAGSGTTAYEAYVYAATGTSLLAPPTINTLTKYDGTLVSTDRVISGTGVAGATITLTLQDGTTRSIPVNNGGSWSYTLKQNEKLTQNTKQDASIKSPNTISAKQTKNGEESSATSVNVQLARAISIDTPLQAGRDISVKVAHDTGRFYIQVRNAANTNTVYEYGVIQEKGRWRIEDSAAANAIDVTVTDGDTPSEKKITLHVNDAHRKNNIPFKITKDHVVRVRSHHVNDANIAADPGHENDGWVTANKATNTNPTIAIKDSNATYTSDGTLTKDKLKTLVTVNDAEDTPGRTVGNSAAENLDVTATKDGKNVDLTKPLKQGTYNLTYRTTDAAGAIATKNHTITVNYAAVAKSKINLVQGESVSDEIKRSLLELRDGNDKVAIPNNARVEVTLDTSAKADSKTAVASVVLQGKTIASTNINYRVLPTFPIAHTVYDFKGVNRSDDESKYYLNTGIPGGMKWFAKRGNEAEIDASGLRDKINADPVGETTYKFGGKYNYGRFTDSPQPNEKLEHAATFTHKVFDIKPNDTKVTVAQGGTLSEAQAISAVAKVTGSPDLPSGTTYEWVDDRGNKITPTANTAGVQNFKVKVTLPPAQSGNDAPEATKRQPSKIITVPVNVTPPAPTVTTEPRYSGTLVSTDRSISGRGIAGATITVALQDGTTGTTLVNNQGEWTYNLKTNEKLTQNTKKDASIKADKEITVKQSKDGVESSATSVNVQLARVISINTPVQAGREITVKVPHDAGQFYVQLNYDTRQVYEYGVKQENGQWKITDPNKANTTELIVKNGDNVSEKELTLRIKDSNKKTNIPFTIPSGENKLRVRVHHVNGQNNPANPASEPGQGWVIASEATNESPTITVKEPTKTAYTADGSLTMAGLKKLVTVADKEDDADKTVGNRASDNFTLTVKQGANVVDLSNNKYLKKGTYTLTYTTRDAAGATARKEHTITVSSLAESKGASITYPADTAKVVYGNSDVENGNFKPATKQTFANKLTEVNRGNNNLPTINGTGVTFTPGTTNDKEKVVVATFPDGSTLDISHAKVAKPAAPTITPSANFQGDLGSTERSISGTGIAGATVKIDLQGGKTVETTVGSDGNWTYNLKNNEVLTQNFKQDANTKSTKPVSVKQVMHGIESTDTTANVQLSDVITFDEPLQAGRDITLRVPHDAGRFYVIIASKEGNTFQYGINKTDNGWQVEESVNNRPTGKTTTELTVSTTSNPAERVFKLHIKDSNQKTDIPFTMKADARSVMARVHYDNSRGNPAAGGNWTYTTPINTSPRITVNAPDTRNYTADGSLTLDGLKRLVTVADTEDDANKTVGRTANENLSVTIRQGNKVVNLANNGYLKKGEYTLTYTTTDAAGVSVTKEHTITVSSIPEVSIKAAKDATAQGIVPTTESNKVINSVTIPSNQPQPISKVLKDNGRITEVDGEKVATVVLTYSDNSTKEVTVPVLEVKPIDIVTTFNEKDNTVTIKPNTTVEINDRLQFGIRGKSMALTKTASGYTNSVNDRTITVNQDGSITITLVGEEKFQAGDRIVTRHESNKNGKVDSYETEAFAGLKPVEKVPVINLTNLTPKEIEDVKAAVKKANPSVNTAELQVAANGNVTYRHKGAGVGTSDPTPEIRLNGNVIKKPSVPEIKTSLEGKANTNTPVEVEVKSDAGTTVKLYDVTGKEIGSATAGSNGTARITVSEKIPVGNVTAKAVSQEGVNSELSAPKNATDTTAPDKPVIETDLTGKANTKTPIVVKAEKGSTVVVKVGNKEIGRGTADETGSVTIIPTEDIPVGDVTATATDASRNESNPSDAKPATDTTKPISSNGVDGNGNLITPPVVDIPEFNGGVNGELPDPVELPKVKLIITKWIDEQGNELKPADAKAPAVLGEANEAFEHGEIEGYVFVRTDVNEEGDVVTHVFRKVTTTKPEGNGEQQGRDNTPQPTPEVPTDNTERKPETEKPTVPDTKQAEQPTQTVDAQVAPSQNQAVLPNTGTKADRATGALGALSLLGAFGLLFAKKKKDDEEETRNN